MALPRLLVSPPVFVFYPELYDGYGGDHHRKQRKMLNPIFSSAHMHEMGVYI